jgi:hypothetical protein
MRNGGRGRPLNSVVRLHVGNAVLHPNQFQVDEAWIAFRLNDVPIRTEQDGPFNVIALMDAASCFILGAEFVAAGKAEPSLPEVKRLLKGGQKQSKKLPVTIFLPQGQFEKIFPAEAERCGISVVRIHESQLLTFIGEARRGFQERFTEGNVREA